jgi:hypothetical protein
MVKTMDNVFLETNLVAEASGINILCNMGLPLVHRYHTIADAQDEGCFFRCYSLFQFRFISVSTWLPITHAVFLALNLLVVYVSYASFVPILVA